jgi:hypothetical protein
MNIIYFFVLVLKFILFLLLCIYLFFVLLRFELQVLTLTKQALSEYSLFSLHFSHDDDRITGRRTRRETERSCSDNEAGGRMAKQRDKI